MAESGTCTHVLAPLRSSSSVSVSRWGCILLEAIIPSIHRTPQMPSTSSGNLADAAQGWFTWRSTSSAATTSTMDPKIHNHSTGVTSWE